MEDQVLATQEAQETIEFFEETLGLYVHMDSDSQQQDAVDLLMLHFLEIALPPRSLPKM